MGLFICSRSSDGEQFRPYLFVPVCGDIFHEAAGEVDDVKRGNHNGSTLVPAALLAMPTSITLKNIPDTVYEALKRSAEANRRSMNNEAIVCLEAALRPNRIGVEERLARIRALHERLPKKKFAAREIDKLKREGRP